MKLSKLDLTSVTIFIVTQYCVVYFPRNSRFVVTWETYQNYARLFSYFGLLGRI